MKPANASQSGFTLVELLIAVIVLSIGILALGRLFPSANQTQQQAKMTSTASYYAQEKLEQLSAASWSDTSLSAGRHPGGTATEDLGTIGAWHRYYNVSALAAPLDDCKSVTVTVTWTYHGNRSTSATTYLRK